VKQSVQMQTLVNEVLIELKESGTALSEVRVPGTFRRLGANRAASKCG